jgi:hypothetical protein
MVVAARSPCDHKDKSFVAKALSALEEDEALDDLFSSISFSKAHPRSLL